MSDIAIRVENLSKAYRIGLKEQQHETMLGAVAAWLKSPFSNFRDVRKLSHFEDIKAEDRRSKIEDSSSSISHLPSSGSALPAPSSQLPASSSQLPSPSSQRDDLFWALRDISFEVKRGEAVGIIGRNGAGKSTLLKILSRITEPTGGRASVFGRVGSLLEVGTGFHPDLTGRENIYLNATILGMRKREVDAKFDQIVDFSGVEKFIDTPVKRYSSGMRVRLAFSVAAHLEPEILVIDEVLAVGDAAFQNKCLGKMDEVAGSGRTVLFVSHNMGALTTLCPRSIWLENGRLIDSGESQALVMKYISRSGELLPSGGYNNLNELERPPSLATRHSEFKWVRALRIDGRQAGDFVEGEPFTVEVGFHLGQSVSKIQLGCGVRPVESQSELFTVPSPEFDSSFCEGHYKARITIAPNYLREGAYRLVLKLFVDGVRQDTIGDVLQISVTACRSTDDLNALSQKWVSGPLLLNYKWDMPIHDGSSLAGDSAAANCNLGSNN